MSKAYARNFIDGRCSFLSCETSFKAREIPAVREVVPVKYAAYRPVYCELTFLLCGSCRGKMFARNCISMVSI